MSDGKGRLLFPGPGGYKIDWSLGTLHVPLKTAPSGHLIMPCGEFDKVHSPSGLPHPSTTFHATANSSSSTSPFAPGHPLGCGSPMRDWTPTRNRLPTRDWYPPRDWCPKLDRHQIWDWSPNEERSSTWDPLPGRLHRIDYRQVSPCLQASLVSVR